MEGFIPVFFLSSDTNTTKKPVRQTGIRLNGKKQTSLFKLLVPFAHSLNPQNTQTDTSVRPTLTEFGKAESPTTFFSKHLCLPLESLLLPPPPVPPCHGTGERADEWPGLLDETAHQKNLIKAGPSRWTGSGGRRRLVWPVERGRAGPAEKSCE